MSKMKLTATTEATLEVNLQHKQMVVARCEEHARLSARRNEDERRMKAIRKEVEDIFKREKQGKALVDGTRIADYSMKLVTGKRKVFDQLGFMKKHGLGQADFDEFTEYVDNEPYIKISVAGGKDDE